MEGFTLDLALISRKFELFTKDIQKFSEMLESEVIKSSFLVIGGAGTIGQSVVKEIFRLKPKKLHVVDISENNLAELVRDLRSSFGYIDGEFKTYALDCGSREYDVFFKNDGSYDYVLNLSALKHVRSEKDPYTIMRMIDVNIFNTVKTLEYAIQKKTKKYFCVSSDKAANPANLMGATKKIMEMYLLNYDNEISISSSRFANVIFSDGSLPYSFAQRIQKKQPIVAPSDIKRYFVTPKEAGLLCLLSCILGENRDIFFPKNNDNLPLVTFEEIARNYIKKSGYKVYECDNEAEARNLVSSLPGKGYWPCFFSASDTTGEKDIEEFYTADEELDLDKFHDIGIVKNYLQINKANLEFFNNEIMKLRSCNDWSRNEIIQIFKKTLPQLNHKETGKFLDEKM